MSATLLSIIGPVGVGKTTLAEYLAAELPADILREDYAGNPFMAESFTGRDELSLPSQLYFLLSRAGQLSRATWPAAGLVITDYGYCQDRLFAKIKLRGEELQTYNFVAGRIDRTIVQPAVMIHLDASVKTLMERIAARGRQYEAAFTEDFIRALRDAHRQVEPPDGCELLRVDCDTIDLRSDETRAKLLEDIRETH
ncbi:MAG: deoxynucleoside kinase [Phycisphaerae bacterium]|nr:deoxynucleoside kinase [Phycisphaerae bacterium]